MSTSPPVLQVLSVIANPKDLPRFDDDLLGRQLRDALQPFQSQATLRYEQLKPPSANALRQSVSSTAWNVVHFIANGQDHSAAHYGTLALELSDGSSGNITGQALAALLAPGSSLLLVVIQSPCEGPPCFNAVAEELVQRGARGVLVAPLFPEQLQIFFLTRLYEGLLLGMSCSQLVEHIAADRPADATHLAQLHMLSHEPEEKLFTPGEPVPVTRAVMSAPLRIAPVPVAIPAPAPAAAEPPWREILRRKRSTETFDVFLCHNTADKPMVRRIGQRLKEAGILPWLDVEELPPGQPWQPLLEKQIKNIRAAAVCFGAAGIGPWQEREMYGFLNAFARRGSPVIPLLLPDAPSVPDLPIFLAEMTWVDFRCPDPDPLAQLIWGITGTRPDLEDRSATEPK
jgi:hypothetical protein